MALEVNQWPLKRVHARIDMSKCGNLNEVESDMLENVERMENGALLWMWSVKNGPFLQ